MSESVYTLESFANFTSVSLSTKSVREYKSCVKHFFEFLDQKDKKPADLSKIDILEYVAILKNRELSASFIKTNFWEIKKYYRYLVKHDTFDRIIFLDIFDDVDLPKVMHKKQEVYLQQDVEGILKVFEKNTDNLVGFGNYIFLLIMATTGARRGEVSLLKVCDIDFATNHITFYNTKNRKPRAVKMNDYLVNNLLKYIEMRKNIVKDNGDYLFLSKDGYKTNVDAIGGRIRDYAKRHDVKIAFHPFRRGFATELANAKVPIDKISKILGHSNINVTAAHYIYSSDLDEATLAYNLFDRNKITLRDSIKNTKIILQNELQNNTQNTNIILQNGIRSSTPSKENILKMLESIAGDVGSLKNLLQEPL